jgi:hypothetical protein
VPGYAGARTLFIVFGLVLIALSLNRLGPAIRLAFTGDRALGEAVQIVRTEPGGAQFVYTTDAEVLASVKACAESRDRASVFWVEYRFTTADGQSIQTRSPLGQHLAPLQPLRDGDGFPSTIRIWYDSKSPERILLPLQFGTWYLPGMLAFFGFLAVFMGIVLRWSAKRPIEMPDLSRSHAETEGGP